MILESVHLYYFLKKQNNKPQQTHQTTQNLVQGQFLLVKKIIIAVRQCLQELLRLSPSGLRSGRISQLTCLTQK